MKGDFKTVCIPEFNDPFQGLTRPHDLDYNHSYYIDLVIRHVAGFEPRSEDSILLQPLRTGLKEFLVENVRCKGQDISVRWKAGEGYVLSVDGKEVKRRRDLGEIEYDL